MRRRGSRPTSGARRRAGSLLRSATADERGSQTLELALALPLLAVLGVVLIVVAGLAVDLVRVQHLARESARAAVLDVAPPSEDDATVSIRRSGGMVTASVQLRRRLPVGFGDGVQVSAETTMVDEP